MDVLLIETSQDILEVKAAIVGCRRAFAEPGRRVPIQAQVTLDTSGRMLLGTDIARRAGTLERCRDVIGLNCSTGPEHMREPIRYLTENSACRSRCIPNAGLPHQRGRAAVYPLSRSRMAEQLRRVRRQLRRERGRRLLRHAPEHIWRCEPAGRRAPKPREVPNVPRLSVGDPRRRSCIQVPGADCWSASG